MVRSRFLMPKCNNETYGYHVYYFLFTKLKHYSVISGKVSREKGVQVDGFRVHGSGLARGACRPLIACESSTRQLGVRS